MSFHSGLARISNPAIASRNEFTPVVDDSTVSCALAGHCGEDETVVLGTVMSGLSTAIPLGEVLSVFL